MGHPPAGRLVPFHSFKPKERSGKHVQAAKRGSLHSLWRRISAPFLIPQSICSHEWQPYDADLAGCVLCGAGHECRDGNCQTEQNEEGFPVCTITGCCVRTVSYSELEYLDSLAVDRRPVRTQRAGPVGEEEGGPHPVCSWDTRRPGDGHFKAGRKNRYRSWVHSKLYLTEIGRARVGKMVESARADLATRSMQRLDKICMFRAQEGGDNDAALRTESIILSYVRGVMCSGVWEQSMRCEIERYDAKKRVLMGKALKAFKSAHPGEMPVVPDIACVMLSAMAGTRLVRMVDMQEREYLSTTCTGCILKHVALLNRMCDGVITECRLKSTTIGMLYLMRQGVVMHGVVVLPKIDRLQHVLPVESHLKSMFGIRGKCITETENIVKVVLRSASRADLESYGVATVENRLVGGSGEAAWGPGWPPAAAPARV